MWNSKMVLTDIIMRVSQILRHSRKVWTLTQVSSHLSPLYDEGRFCSRTHHCTAAIENTQHCNRSAHACNTFDAFPTPTWRLTRKAKWRGIHWRQTSHCQLCWTAHRRSTADSALPVDARQPFSSTRTCMRSPHHALARTPTEALRWTPFKNHNLIYIHIYTYIYGAIMDDYHQYLISL